MCDFHRSLDRALEPHTDLTVNRYFPHDPVVDVAEAHPLDHADLAGIQAVINEHVSKMARLGAWAIDSTTAYDVEPGLVDNSFVVTFEPDPEPLRFYSNGWVQRYMAGSKPDWRPPLCEQEIPAEGVE